MRPLAFVDCETTGLDPARHELLEVAAIRVSPQTLAVETELAMMVRPTRTDDADPEALRIVGYSEEAWSDALPLREAMAQLAPILDGAMLAGHNVAFDRGFLDAAWKQVGHRPENLDHHLLDTATMAWPLLSAKKLDSVSLTPVCKYLGIERGKEHAALADARASLEVARRLLNGQDDHAQVSDGAGEKRALFRTRRVYVCHPYRNAPAQNVEQVTAICKELSASGLFPVAPQLYLPQFVDEATERERALALCLELLDVSDEVRVYGRSITDGMLLEIERADARGIPVHFMDAETA